MFSIVRYLVMFLAVVMSRATGWREQAYVRQTRRSWFRLKGTMRHHGTAEAPVASLRQAQVFAPPPWLVGKRLR